VLSQYHVSQLNCRPETRLLTPAAQRVRQSWNKYNLYNLSRLRLPNITPKTFFQQKFFAKQLTRGYHGEHLREKQWERMFSRRLQSVVDMQTLYMALHDGSEQAEGRGSGRDVPPSKNENPGGLNFANQQMTPYMNMTFAPQERRLDVAVFRALFASSVRQARQMCVHGAVKVNGKVVRDRGSLGCTSTATWVMD
jgi:ribosomal protein S4